MTIKVYSSIMPDAEVELYEACGVTIEQWVKGKTKDYKAGDKQPLSCSINGTIIKPSEWASRVIQKDDLVEFRVVPYGLGVAAWLLIGASVVTAAYAVYTVNNIDKGKSSYGDKGSAMGEANAKANMPKLGEQVPEILGRYIRYPDYLVPPRTRYVAPRVKTLRLFMCVGAGEYEIEAGSIRIGETPIDDIPYAEYAIMKPNDDVGWTTNSENWYECPEVSATTNSAGIRLRGMPLDERTYSGSGTASGDVLTLGFLKGSWTDGLIGSIMMNQDITAVAGAAGEPDIITGRFTHISAGDRVTIESQSSSFGGIFLVASKNSSSTKITLTTLGLAPVTGVPSYIPIINIEKSGTSYEVIERVGSLGLRVKRIMSTGAEDTTWSGVLPQGAVGVKAVWRSGTSSDSRVGPFAATPKNEEAKFYEVDVFAPIGLGVVDGETVSARSRDIAIQYRKAGTNGAWTALGRTVSGATRDQLGWTFSFTTPTPMAAEIRVVRVSDEDIAITSLDTIEVTAIRAQLAGRSRYKDMTTIAVTITDLDKIGSGSNNKINLVATRKLPEITSTGFTAPVATRSIAAAACHVAKSLGYDDSQLDLSKFKQLDDLWRARGDYFDHVINSGTAKDAIDNMLQAGFSSMTLEGGVITPVRDGIRTVFEDGYSPENMTAPLRRSYQSKQVGDTDGVEVEYTDERTWTTETITCLLPEDNGFKLDKIKIEGVTNRTKAWRIGMRRRRAQKYARWTYDFDTELDALNSSYLSYVPLLDDIPGYGKVSLLEEVYADRIIVSEPMEFEAGKQHVVAYRRQDGEVVGPFPCTQGGTEDTILCTLNPLPNPDDEIHVYFGTAERWSFPALITDISPSGPLSVSVTAVNYDERIYADDDNAPS